MTFLHANVDGFATHSVDILTVVKGLVDKPMIICLNETKLLKPPPGQKPDNIAELEGYKIICRRDRDSINKGGGIAVYARSDIFEQITLLEVSKTEERAWFMVHTDQGPYLLGCWYRPPGESLQGIYNFRDEFDNHRPSSVGAIIIGDLNIHQQSWLRFSDGDTPAGRLLQEMCMTRGMRQLVKQPTRYENLLDLVITDIPSATVEVGAKIRDHNCVKAGLNLTVQQSFKLKREVWDYRKANWGRMRDMLEDTN